MTVGSVSCVCGGKNKNCFSCLVAGNVKPVKTKQISRVRVVHQQKQTPGEDDGLVQFERIEEPYLGVELLVVCDECGVTVKNLDLHRKKVHTVQAVAVNEAKSVLDTPAKAPANPLFTLVKCPICSSMVGDLAKHMKKANHIDEANRHTRLVMQAETGEMICPVCTSRWPNRAEVSSHVERAHGKHARAELRFALPRRPIL